MADENLEQNVPDNILNMSDEEIASLDPASLVSAPQQDETKNVDESKDEDDSEDNTEDDKDEDKSAEDSAKIDDEDDVDPDNPDGDLENKDKSEKPTSDKKADEPKDDAKQKSEGEDAEKAEEKKPDEKAIDYEAAYKKLTAPFKANGREIQVTNVDDAIALMQMGANYNKKMAALKPNLRLMKLLENNGLLNEEKLSFLIDLDKKNPDAINKLVKDSGIDPMDITADKASGYKPNTYTVDDREVELDTVLEDIQDSPAYNRTLEIVSNKWDGASKQVIAKTPQLLKVINDHVESGIYDLIQKEIESERMFGRLKGLSDLEAYRQVGDAINARGGFNHLGRQETESPKSTVVPLKPKKADDDKLREKKRAASSTKPAAPTTTPKDFNPLSLSDEEFSKQVNSKFL